jgi:hypothetical protein
MLPLRIAGQSGYAVALTGAEETFTSAILRCTKDIDASVDHFVDQIYLCSVLVQQLWCSAALDVWHKGREQSPVG